MRKHRMDQNGAVSLLSVVVFMLIITIVATSYMKSVISQQKNALNYDFANRAYYAAESGVQDGIRALNADATLRADGRSACTPLLGGDSSGNLGGDFDLSYTCQIINPNVSKIRTQLSGDQNKMIRLQVKNATAGATYKVVVQWSSKLGADVPTGTVGLEPRDNSAKYFMPEGNWSVDVGGGERAGIHPALRASIVSYPATGNITRNTLKQRVLFLNPVRPNNTANNNGTIASAVNANTDQDPASVVQQAACYSQSSSDTGTFDSFSCQAIITLNNSDFTTNSIFLRLKSLQAATNAQIYLTNSANNQVSFDSVAADVDVTGRASNVFKRVKQTVPINNGVTTDTLPEAAVVGGDGICKLYRVGENTAQFNDIGGCFQLTAQ